LFSVDYRQSPLLERDSAATGKITLQGTQLDEISLKYQQKLILKQLKELTGLLKKIERRMGKIERKLDY